LRNEIGVPVGLSSTSVFRFAAGILAALWAMSGLANDYAIVAGAGFAWPVVIAIAANLALALGASLALVNAQSWRVILLTTLAVVTIDRIFAGVASAALPQISAALVVCIAISVIALASSRLNGV
jgi:hypothetical protein